MDSPDISRFAESNDIRRRWLRPGVPGDAGDATELGELVLDVLGEPDVVGDVRGSVRVGCDAAGCADAGLSVDRAASEVLHGFCTFFLGMACQSVECLCVELVRCRMCRTLQHAGFKQLLVRASVSTALQ